VRRLRAWMDQPKVMGLPRDIQNLVITGFALQNNYAFALHGTPVEPRLERLDDTLELRPQALPDEAVWQEATRRAGAILGLVTSPLLNATSLARLAEDTKRAADQYRPAVTQLCTALHTRLTQLGTAASDAPRLQTAQAALSLVNGIAEAETDDVVEVVASAEVVTSETAMAQSINKAAALVATLDNTPWDLFERMRQLPVERAPHAPAIAEQVKDALTRDEHVVHLAEALHAARSAAFELLTSIVEASRTPTRPPAEPAAVSPPPLTRTTTNTRRGITGQEALDLLECIKQDLASHPDLALDIEWRLYRQDEAAP
jgi:hypothetical protein